MNGEQAIVVMIHAPCWREGLMWYEKAFPEAIRHREEGNDFEHLSVAGVIIEVVRADDKVPVGAAGTVVYWSADDFEERLDYLLSMGATLYRGPMTTKSGIRLCQVKDPFGNSLGLRSYLPGGK